MNAKRFVSEPLILVFVGLIDLASLSALFLCQRDMSSKESAAAAQSRHREAASISHEPVETPDTRLHYSPDAINALLHPVAGKLRGIAHPVPVAEGSAAVTQHP